MENLDKNRVPKAWVGREVAIKTLSMGLHEAMTVEVEGSPPGGRPSRPPSVVRFGKLEDVHEAGVVLSWMGPTPDVAELGPVLFYPWSAVEELRLRVAPPERPETYEEPRRDRTGAGRRSQRLPARTEPKLSKVVPIAQQSSAAGITITLRSLEIYEGGHSLIGYLVSPALGAEEDRPLRYSFPEVRVRDNRGRFYEARAGNVVRALSGELWLANLSEADTAELEVEVVRLFKGPSGEGRSESLDGPWIFRFPL